jgi:hypothetical protein
MFLTTLMLIGVTVTAPALRTEIRREKELDMIWRGKQYVRAIKLYYHKTGRFPTSLDDLSKPKLGSIRFLRQAYKDPMNKEDGSWRLIYVGPGGQLIGTKKRRTLRLPGSMTQASTRDSKASGTQTASRTASGAASNSAFSFGSSQTPSESQSADSKNADSKDTKPDDSSSDETLTIIGGNIIGVASKVKHPSVITYEEATNYQQFEFIWDPSKDSIGGVGGVPIQGASPQGISGPQPSGFRNRGPRGRLPNQPTLPPLQGP